jgi:hypothetical protein
MSVRIEAPGAGGVESAPALPSCSGPCGLGRIAGVMRWAAKIAPLRVRLESTHPCRSVNGHNPPNAIVFSRRLNFDGVDAPSRRRQNAPRWRCCMGGLRGEGIHGEGLRSLGSTWQSESSQSMRRRRMAGRHCASRCRARSCSAFWLSGRSDRSRPGKAVRVNEPSARGLHQRGHPHMTLERVAHA